jgi:ligand-binding SRPBCC domain-containing protein
LGSVQRRTHLPASVADALTASLDLDVELAVGSRWHLRTLRGGYSFRTSGIIGRGEMVRWSMRLWGIVPVRHTSKIVMLVEDDGQGGAMFVDQMTTGVFSSYRHEHRYAVDGAGTWMTDDVSWRVPAGPFGALADRVYVGRMMARLVDERNAEILRRLSDSSLR